MFGSRARGNHRPDSDWDVAVLLNDGHCGWDDIAAAGDVGTQLMDEAGESVDVVLPPPGGLERSVLGSSVRRDGVPL
ncbi:nucleotidyltransferase domain-containing protein (plasmid) [Azospirillum brasilense]|nr:nucleotidyltransferase domain-containing protein [Azospirillum brasilense]